MTARAGDALSHVLFQCRRAAPQRSFCRKELVAQTARRTAAIAVLEIRSIGNCMAAMTVGIGTKSLDSLHLAITYADLTDILIVSNNKYSIG